MCQTVSDLKWQIMDLGAKKACRTVIANLLGVFRNDSEAVNYEAMNSQPALL